MVFTDSSTSATNIWIFRANSSLTCLVPGFVVCVTYCDTVGATASGNIATDIHMLDINGNLQQYE